MTESLQPRFLDATSGALFTVCRAPSAQIDEFPAVLLVPPFGEELNKSRAVLTDTAKALARGGMTSLLFDPFGCGDSSGTFEQATWEGWRRDLNDVLTYLDNRSVPVRAVVAVRSGCSLAAEALAESGRKVDLMAFVQPLHRGATLLKQLIRVRTAASMVKGADRESATELLERLLAGESLDLAGYRVGSAMGRALQDLRLDDVPPSVTPRLHCVEIARSRENPALTTATENYLARASDAGSRVTSQALPGEPFWTATEIVRHADLANGIAAIVASEIADAD